MAFHCELRAEQLLEAELLALQRSLNHPSDSTNMTAPSTLGIQIEGACLVLITSIKNLSHLTWETTSLWKRTMHVLSELANWTIPHCKRSANRVADMLAHYDIPENVGNRAPLPSEIREVADIERARAASDTHSFFTHPVDDLANRPQGSARPTRGGVAELSTRAEGQVQLNDQSA
ncbi:hypothetical protein AAC387_Pa01g2128 [Persea americana]